MKVVVVVKGYAFGITVNEMESIYNQLKDWMELIDNESGIMCYDSACLYQEIGY